MESENWMPGRLCGRLNSSDMANASNVFTELPHDLPEELFAELPQAPGIRIERIVSRGHCSQDGFWYDQDQPEWVLVLKGEARIQFEDRVLELQTWGFMNISAHQKHSVSWTTPDKTSQR
jgi:cupin 2 domain-containing protein